MLIIATADHAASVLSTLGSLGDVFQAQKTVQKECDTCPLDAQYITAHDQFHQVFPRVSTASDKPWGEKARVRGYILPLKFSSLHKPLQ